MDDALILTVVGGLLLGGLAVDWLGRRINLPRVTLLLLFGFCVGPGALDVLPPSATDWFPLVTKAALAMIGFLLGERFTPKRLRAQRKQVIGISLIDVIGTMAVLSLGLILLGEGVELAVLLAAVAAATAPAATFDVVNEYRAEGRFTDTLLGIVAIDDAWGLIAFSLVLAAIAGMTNGDGGIAILGAGLWEVSGALLLGAVLGVPAGLLSHRIAPGEPTLLEALGLVFLCAGVAGLLHVSFILSAMFMGATAATVGIHHERAFHEIEHIERPFLVLFFVLAGASLELHVLPTIGAIGAAYIVLRVLARLVSVWAGARLTGADPAVRRWLGLALLPQAGVALGMALMVKERLPELGATILPLVIGSTVVFELLGPVGTRYALRRAGEARVD